MSRPFHARPRKPAPPLDAARLDALALAYVARYATSRAKLAAYLRRKLAAGEWEGRGDPPVEAIVARCAELGYVDDAAFAAARGAALGRRGYGERRVGEALRHAGIAEEEAAPVRDAARDNGLEAAIIFARRRRLGPFARTETDDAERRRAYGALVRAGHSHEIARKVAFAAPGSSLDEP